MVAKYQRNSSSNFEADEGRQLCKIDGKAEVIHHAIPVLIGQFTRLDRRRFPNTFATTHIFIIEDYLINVQKGQRKARIR